MKSYGQHCPIALTLDVIGDRWTMLIIRDLYFGRVRFNDLAAAMPGMSTKILAERLKSLEEHGLVERRTYNERPPRAEYHLTDLGMSLEPVLNAIGEWGGEHLVDSGTAAQMRQSIDARRPASSRTRTS